jgi:uncharacterized phage protein (TIGR01671 family)
MREIKLRAWIDEETKFVFPSKFSIFETVAYIYDPDVDYELQISPDCLQQYTGLKDKNGKESYEGDILGRPYESLKQVGVVEFDKGEFFAKLRPSGNKEVSYIFWNGRVSINPKSLATFTRTPSF